MNYKKLILVGIISAFVALLTSIMGVTGTIIGSVISSVLYNMLTEAVDQPSKKSLSTNFEWDIAYVFPIVVIALIQLLLIFALLAEIGLVPPTFLNFYLSLQNLANNNLYRLLGVALLIISAYPLVLKPEFVKKEHGGILALVGLIFLARGFVDLNTTITNIYDDVFVMFDLPIAIIAFVLLAWVVVRILISAKNSHNDEKVMEHHDHETINKIHKHGDFEYKGRNHSGHKKLNSSHNDENSSSVSFKNHVEEHQSSGINESTGNIKFESNDLLDDYKK